MTTWNFLNKTNIIHYLARENSDLLLCENGNFLQLEDNNPWWNGDTKNSSTWSQLTKNITTWASPTKN